MSLVSIHEEIEDLTESTRTEKSQLERQLCIEIITLPSTFIAISFVKANLWLAEPAVNTLEFLDQVRQ